MSYCGGSRQHLYLERYDYAELVTPYSEIVSSKHLDAVVHITTTVAKDGHNNEEVGD